ncbi:MAG: branched-chain-amino-acid transaminase [Peptococcaceae bacterium]|nr:branched-chain-amino-acid transaminase [Peptococcaceae bacterium]
MARLVYLNGAYVPENEAFVSVFDHGFLYGDGVFETMRAYGGQVFKLAEHLARLHRSAAAIFLEIPLAPGELAEVVRETVRRNGLAEAYVRLSVSRGPGPVGIDPRRCTSPTVVCLAGEVPGDLERLRRQGVRAVITRTRRVPAESLDPAAKTCNFLNGIVAKIEASRAGAFEGIMLNTRGEVAEGTVSNVFICRKGALLTPAAAAGILRGITRDTVLALARDIGLQAEEALFGPSELFGAEEVFLTNSSWEVMPVTELDGRPVGGGVPGPVAGLLRQEYRRLVAGVLEREKPIS